MSFIANGVYDYMVYENVTLSDAVRACTDERGMLDTGGCKLNDINHPSNGCDYSVKVKSGAINVLEIGKGCNELVGEKVF